MGTNIEDRPAKIREIQEEYGLAPLVRPGSGDAVVLISEGKTGRNLQMIPAIHRQSPLTEVALARRIEEPLISLEEQGNAIGGVRGIVKQKDESQRNAIRSFFRAVAGIVQDPAYEHKVVDTAEYKGSLAGRARIVKTTREKTSQPVLPKKAELTITEKPAKIEVRKSVAIGEMTITTYRDSTVVTEIRAPLQQ